MREGVAACGIANTILGAKGIKKTLDLKMFVPQLGGVGSRSGRGANVKRPMSAEEWQDQMGPWKALAEQAKEKKRRRKERK